MKIGAAIPEVFSRTYTTLDPSTHMLVALSLLKFEKVDAIPIGVVGYPGKKRAVSGYSSLSEIHLNQGDITNLLAKPCENFSVIMKTIKAESDIKDLLRIISRTGFGCVCIERNSGKEVCGMVSLRDLLALYDRSIFFSELSVGDVASSPVFSLPKSATLEVALGEMLKRGIRRIFVAGTDKVVSDRSFINHVFSLSRLQVAGKSLDLLETEIGEIEGSHPDKISSKTSIKEAAEHMMQTSQGCLVCDRGVVTPWDLVVKPWKLGKLSVS